MSKLKAIAIHGPPVVVDAAIRAFRRMRFHLMGAPDLPICLPRLEVTLDADPRKTRTRMVYPELDKRSRAAIQRGASIISGLFNSDDEYRCSLRAFKAAWHGVPLCEEPRC